MLRIKADIQKVKKLINIARPIELPPLKNEDTKSAASQTKKKFELPLFGKKKTFGFDRLKQQSVNAKSAQPSESKPDENQSIEEFDEDENDAQPTKQTTESASKAFAKENPVVEAPKTETSCDEETKESTGATTKQKPEIEEKQQQIKDEKKMPTSKNSDNDHHKPIPSPPPPSVEVAVEKTNTQNAPVVGSKNRNKHRNRNKARQQIDIDDTEEDTSPQKYSGWMPPTNQSGDGMTDLNSKYGY